MNSIEDLEALLAKYPSYTTPSSKVKVHDLVKRAALELVVNKSFKVVQVSSVLGISENTLYKWSKDYRDGTPATATAGSYTKSIKELESDLWQAKCEALLRVSSQLTTLSFAYIRDMEPFLYNGIVYLKDSPTTAVKLDSDWSGPEQFSGKAVQILK